MNKKRFILLLSLALIVIFTAAFVIFRGPKIAVQTDGELLSLRHNFRDDNYTVVWECDAGSLSLADADSLYTSPTKNAYYVYAGLGEAVKWTPQDSDGFSYPTATIRAQVFRYSKSSGRYGRCDDKTFPDAALTVSAKGGAIVKSDPRRFGNPVRENSDTNWQQILAWDKQGNYITLRYRSGKAPDSSERVVWHTNAALIRKAKFFGAPVYVPGEMTETPSPFLFDTDTICFDFSRFCNWFFDGSNSEAYPAKINIAAAAVDKNAVSENDPNRDLPSDAAKLVLTYYYGETGSYTVE